jgi:UDP-N-acetylglucosamine 4,6-dehydratase
MGFLEATRLFDFLAGTRVLITGGAGSLGRALVRNLLTVNPSQIIIFSRDEAKHARYFSGNSKIKCIIGDVRDYEKILLSSMGVDYIVHAGALKRIDALEYNPVEAIKTNVDGTINVAKAGYVNKAKKCLLVSTDKACMATSTYGATKFLGEKVFSYFDYEFGGDTRFSSVRYGNVVGSRGSFIPYWIGKIKNGEKIPITLMDMTRFLLTLDDAAKTVLKALEHTEGGEIFVPRIRSFKISDIMEVLAEHYHVDLRTENMGKRAGEKLHEDLINVLEAERAFVIEDLLIILPEITRRSYSYKEKYEGGPLNSGSSLETDRTKILSLLQRGIRL